MHEIEKVDLRILRCEWEVVFVRKVVLGSTLEWLTTAVVPGGSPLVFGVVLPTCLFGNLCVIDYYVITDNIDKALIWLQNITPRLVV